MRLEFVEGTSKKFWEATQTGKKVTVKWGRLGSEGQQKVHTFRSAISARIELDKLVLAKEKKGYRAPSAEKKARPAQAREPKLEAAMFDAPGDAAKALVYADWLQANGHSWGELISVQHARTTKRDDKDLRKRELSLLKGLELPSKDFIDLTWQLGTITAAHFFNEKDWMDNALEPMPVARAVFDLPMCDGLRELRTGVLRWERNQIDVPALLKEASTRPFAKRLERLFLGDINENVDMDHHVIGDVRKLSDYFPNLSWLKLHSGGRTWDGTKNFEFGPLKLPKLKTLIIETCTMTGPRLKSVVNSRLPELETLELWFGSPEYGATARAMNVQPILEGKLFPKLKHLGLKNSERIDEMCALLPMAGLATRLETLDVSLGTLGAEGVASLLKASKSLTKLRTLNVSESYLTDDQVRELRRAFRQATVIASDLKELDEDDPEGRYCSVHE